MARTKDPILKLQLRHDVAVRQFFDAADELDEVAAELTEHAGAAEAVAATELARAAEARVHADAARRRAGRIRELLG
jgi:hypothetical protein